ncbi:MAG: hypothetical protein AAF637_08650, partial [Pseudomonadota bacterium]
SPIEMPKQIEFRDELPKSAVGKILKRELLDDTVGTPQQAQARVAS